MVILDICENSSVLNLFYIIKIIITLISIVVPLILMISLMINIVKEIAGDKDSLLNDILKSSSRKIIATIALFLVPTLVNVLTGLTPGNKGYISCYRSATPEYIAQRESEEKALLEMNNAKYKEYNAKLAAEAESREQQRLQSSGGYSGGGGSFDSGDDGTIGSGSAGTESVGSYKNWKQADPRWANNRLGASTTIGDSGCTSTSVAMALAKSGVKTNLSTDLSPASFVDWMNKNGGYSENDLYWGIVTNLAPSFKYVGKTDLYGTNAQKTTQIKAALDRGEYVICAVNGTGHWVFVDYIEDGHVYILDPGSADKKELFDYSGVTLYDSYKVG